MRLQNRQGCTIDLTEKYKSDKSILKRTTYPTGNVTESHITDDEAHSLVKEFVANRAFRIIFN